jgi:hypothetical protein
MSKTITLDDETAEAVDWLMERYPNIGSRAGVAREAITGWVNMCKASDRMKAQNQYPGLPVRWTVSRGRLHCGHVKDGLCQKCRREHADDLAGSKPVRTYGAGGGPFYVWKGQRVT